MRVLLALPLLFASPAFAQEDLAHSTQDPTSAAPSSPAPSDNDAPMDHAMMGHGTMDHATMDHATMDHATMDHATMDHSTMDHSTMGHTAVPAVSSRVIPRSPPPPEAFSGPAFAADAYVGAQKMAASRAKVVREASGMPVFWLMADRAELRAHEGKDGYTWDVQAVYGGHIDKLWLKSEGEGDFGETPERAEVQALWSHAIGPWWDIQTGVRQDLTGPSRTHAVIGLQGLAPYLFEVNAAAFLSDRGDVTARIEGELDQRITQRLILQPRAEINLAAQDVPEAGIGAGFDRIETGLRLRYEIRREFAPYVGIAQEWKLGTSADFARAAGEKPSATRFVAGIRFWF